MFRNVLTSHDLAAVQMKKKKKCPDGEQIVDVLQGEILFARFGRHHEKGVI